MKEFLFSEINSGDTSFSLLENKLGLNRLFGYEMLSEGLEVPFRMRNMFDLFTSFGIVNEQSCKLIAVNNTGNSLIAQWSLYGGKLQYEMKLTSFTDLGIWKRSDKLINKSQEKVYITKALANYILSPDEYQVFSQSSRWCYENDGEWRTLHNIYMESEGGRTTQGSTPFLAIKSKEHTNGIAFHIIPQGNWEITVKSPSGGVGKPGRSFYQLQLGHSTNNLMLPIEPEAELILPELLIQNIPNGLLHEGAPKLHKYFLQVDNTRHAKVSPIVYNPWFDNYANLDNAERLRKHLSVAKILGCEVFEIDAGWYGAGEGDWWQQAGDWRERVNGAFKGNMRQFVEEVHLSGLEFGLWMEPERVSENAPIRKLKPEWFAWGNGDYYPKLYIKEVYDYLYSEMTRLIKDYSLAWMKLDFNFELGLDELGTNFYEYYKAWYKLLDELRENNPQVFFEGCASGSLRSDINTVAHFDGHFMSDNVNPWDILNSYCQAILRLPPHRLLKWLVLQPGADIMGYDSKTISTVITPAPPGAGFDKYESIDLDFACLLTASGMFGLSGNFIELKEEQINKVKHYIEFYKAWRAFFKDCCVYMNREPKKLGDRNGWISLQFKNIYNDTSLLYVFKLNDLASKKKFTLKEIDIDKQYNIIADDKTSSVSGKELIENGLEVTLDGNNRGKMFIIEACK